MRGVLVGVLVLYSVGAIASSGANAIMLWDHGWPISAVAWPAIEQGLLWPVHLVRTLATI